MTNTDWTREYPRPQLRRSSFYCLNGQWLLDGRPIEVPYPPQSALSGFEGPVPEELLYERRFVLPAQFARPSDRVWLHFGAVDQIAAVFVNGKPAVRHEGGYLPFKADVTDLLDAPGQENLLTVQVTDTLSHDYPYGKQRKDRGGMWYTPVSGIWQTVWMEAVPAAGAVESLRITPDLTGVTLEVATDAPYTVVLQGQSGEYRLPGAGGTLRIDLPALGEQPRLWSPDDPYLYRFAVETAADRVESYFALRTSTIETVDGRARLCLNGKPIFWHGLLDQGYFEDGIYLPAGPDGYEADVLNMKALGFNLLRKHIKIEPEAFYYFCDKHGMLVMQDMVNNGSYTWLWDTALPNIGLQKRPDRYPWGKRTKAIFEAHAAATQDHLYNHPCIVSYTVFNEGWGQFDSDRVYAACKAKDPTRIYDATSGWFAQKQSDLESLHVYFKTVPLAPSGPRPLLLSECGGYTRPIEGHRFNTEKTYGYGAAESEAELTDKIEVLYETMVLPSIPGGLCGCIYTQVSDVEDEVNGLYTYDRAVCKVDAARMRAIAAKLGVLRPAAAEAEPV